jgi:hypothetical protein
VYFTERETLLKGTSIVHDWRCPLLWICTRILWDTDDWFTVFVSYFVVRFGVLMLISSFTRDSNGNRSFHRILATAKNSRGGTTRMGMVNYRKQKSSY